MAQSEGLTGNSSGDRSRRSSPARRNPVTLVGGTSGFACSRDRLRLTAPAAGVAAPGRGRLVSAVRVLLSLRFGEGQDLVRDLPGVVVALPLPDAGEGAVGELLQQAPDPLGLGAAQRQVVLRLDQEEPGHLG